MLQLCQSQALQFNSLRYAQYSTMRLIYAILHPSPHGADAQKEAVYCLPGCRHGRRDDGSMMIACDVCDLWYHPSCLAQQHVPDSPDEAFVCPLCVDSKADVYLAGSLLGGSDSQDGLTTEYLTELLGGP